MKAISQSDFDLAKGDHDEGAAAVEVAKAALETAKLNLDWTIVTAPISGRISRQLIDPGNLVKADNTVLTTSSRSTRCTPISTWTSGPCCEFRRLLQAGKVIGPGGPSCRSSWACPTRTGYPHEGRSTSSTTRWTR